jgi:erythromycin esterase-like protein
VTQFKHLAASLPLAAFACVATAQEPVGIIKDGGAWVLQHAIKPSSVEAGHGFDDLRGLDSMIGDARIVALGEPTHGTREAFQMKHRLLEYLVENKGFSIFSIEANMPESYALNDYIIDGKGDPKKLIAGMYFWTWQTEEVLAMVNWMRDWNARNPPETGKPRLQFTGFDMQVADVAWSISHEFIKEHAPDLVAQSEPLLKDVNLLMSRAGSLTQSGWTTATGTFPVNDAKGKKLTFSSWIRTEGVTGFAGAWWRCDTPAGVNGFNNMEDKRIGGTTEWSRHEFTIDVPEDTKNINFGFILSGDGAAWFDDVEILLDGVKYENPAMFTFDFENDAVRFLQGSTSEYSIKRVKTAPHGGATCLEIRRKPESEQAKVDPAAVLAATQGLVSELVARREVIVQRADAKATDWAIQNARVVAQCASMFAAGQAGFNVRDESMALNVQWILQHNPGQKIVLWAHNGHVTRDLNFGLTPMGVNLAKVFDQQMISVGFATGKGVYTAVDQGAGMKHDNPLVEPGPESVEAVFRASGLPLAIVDVRGSTEADPGRAWAATPRPMRSIGAVATPMQFAPSTAAKAFDVLIWIDETTASRPLSK